MVYNGDSPKKLEFFFLFFQNYYFEKSFGWTSIGIMIKGTEGGVSGN